MLLITGLCYGAAAYADNVVDQSVLDNCTSCHGKQGVSTNSAWPNLAGQKRNYLVTQMRAFRDGIHQNALMSAPMQGLSNQQIDYLADYYAQLPAANAKSSTSLNESGRNVRAYCISCHGMHGQTVNSEWPNLQGQQKEYLYQQLLKYRDGTRIHPLMNVIAKELNEQQMSDVAEFYSQSQSLE